MFQQRRQVALGNINLGQLSAPPSFEDMSFLLDQATKFRGRFVELGWVVGQTGATFQLTTKVTTGQSEPMWMLYRGAVGNSQLVWGHHSNDLTLMHNLVTLECDKPVDGGNNISANAMDNMVSTNRNAGAIAGGAGEQAASAPRATGAQAVTATAGSPAATWLQNLSYGTSAAPQSVPDVTNSTALPEAGTACGAEQVQPPLSESTIDLSLDGSLANISVANLFKYLINNRLSGRLAVQSSIGSGEVFFFAGAIKHAATLDSKGDNALYDMATWQDGQFFFYADEQTAQRTVISQPEVVLDGSARIVEYYKALLQAGLNPASYLVRRSELSRAQFEQAVQSGLPVDLHTQYRFYDTVQGNQTFAEILRSCPLVRAEWIPLVYNLLRCGLLEISERPAFARPGMYLEGEQIDKLAVEGFLASVSEADGLLSSGAFLFMLQQEFHRHERTGSRFALVFFTIAKTNLLDGHVEPIDNETFAEAARRIVQCKRKLDVVGHFDETTCAMLLPETDAAGAAVLANRLIQLMSKPALSRNVEGQVLVHSYGIASLPDDVRDVETLVAAARVAKNKSKMMGAPVILYAEDGK